MGDSSESWESASQIELVLDPAKETERRRSARHTKLKMLHQLLYIAGLLRKPRSYWVSHELNQHEIYREIKNKDQKLISKVFPGFYGARNGLAGPEQEISKGPESPCIYKPAGHAEIRPTNSEQLANALGLFISLNRSGVPARIYFALDDGISAFVEHAFGNKVVEESRRFDGNVFSVSMDGLFLDQTVVFSKKCTYHRIFKKLLALVGDACKAIAKSDTSADASMLFGESADADRKSRVAVKNHSNAALINGIPIGNNAGRNAPANGHGASTMKNPFERLDEERLIKVPTSIRRLKLHPLYMTEKMCKKNEFIYPKRPACGTVNGETVYLRARVQRLRSERGWYMLGRTIRPRMHEAPTKPYRIIAGRRLFAEFQTEPLAVREMTEGLMDAFHQNFTPQGCVYIDYPSEICQCAGIKHSDCLVGFRGREMLIRGFFIRKEDCFVVNELAREREYYRRIGAYNEEYEKTMRSWRSMLRRLDRYLKIREHVGI